MVGSMARVSAISALASLLRNRATLSVFMLVSPVLVTMLANPCGKVRVGATDHHRNLALKCGGVGDGGGLGVTSVDHGEEVGYGIHLLRHNEGCYQGMDV